MTSSASSPGSPSSSSASGQTSPSDDEDVQSLNDFDEEDNHDLYIDDSMCPHCRYDPCQCDAGYDKFMDRLMFPEDYE